MSDKRFSEILGDEYKFLKMAYPHHDEFQDRIGNEVKSYCSDLEIDEIKVVEAGSGSGVSSIRILQADKRISLYAIDNEPKMLDQMDLILGDEINRVNKIESDILEFTKKSEDNSFDIFVSVWTLHNLRPEYRAELFKEVARTLKPGGLFVSGDKYAVSNMDSHNQMLESQLDEFRKFEEYGHKQLAEEWVKHNIEDDGIKISEEDQRNILNNLSFKNVKTIYREKMEAIIVGLK